MIILIQKTYSIRKPTDLDSELYKNFCNLYSFIEISTNIYNSLLNDSNSEKLQVIIDDIIKSDHQDIDNTNKLFTGMGLKFESALDTKNPRGLITNVFNGEESYKETLENLFLIQEFMLLYSITEDNLKKFLVKKSPDIDKKSMINQENIISDLFHYLEKTDNENETILLDIIKEKSENSFKNQNEITLVWKYYSRLRNLYVHSAGKTTRKFINGISGLKTNLVDMFSQKDWVIINLLVEDEEMILDLNFEENEIYFLKHHQLNFFRNFMIILFESINEVLIS